MAVDIRAGALTLVALIAFASNSLLTRLALGAHLMDAATFTSTRLVSGAVVLALIVRAQTGERPGRVTWLGFVLAMVGLATLTVPSAARPDPLGLLLMAIAGVAWGAYSLIGKTTPDPIASNAWSFLWSSLLAILVNLALFASVVASAKGIGLALISGAVTSALGYAVWYRALRHLTVTQGAVAQLSVPVIAALGAAVFLDERLTVRFAISGLAILGGVGLVLSARSRSRARA